MKVLRQLRLAAVANRTGALIQRIFGTSGVGTVLPPGVRAGMPVALRRPMKWLPTASTGLLALTCWTSREGGAGAVDSVPD